MYETSRYYYRELDRISAAISEHAAAEARWLASARRRGGPPSQSGERERLIRETAYLRAQRRGFAPGGEVEDWLAAEQEVDSMMRPLR